MKCFLFGILAHVVLINACLEPAASVHIHNYDGPIYVSQQDGHVPICNNCSPTCNNCSPTCNSCPPTCDNCPPTSKNCQPIANNCPPVYDNRPPTLTNLAPACDNRSPTLTYLPTCDQTPPILHNVPYTICETDCKCITKHTNVPCNSIQPNTCSTGVYSYYPQYPDNYYGYGCPDGQTNYPETDLSCPRISEMIPLLKTLLTQTKSVKNNSQNSQQYQCYSV